ncbi:MAG: YbhB/YbcL family Raf kinase inhibitor-like protein [Deltaproteobacteria bacterium]|nr:YbhB/YbcL family Raf kinase inhibitor-like protein [Deltaproteobacteria bacterium]
MAFEITSPVFQQEKMIPPRYTCDGENISPVLSWRSPPPGTESYALICEDPDAPAGMWVHWVVYNIPAKSRGFPEAIPAQGQLADGTCEGINDFRRVGYGGPCPPAGTHRYYFKLYALDSRLDLPPGANRSALLHAMEGHILGETVLIGRYKRLR